MRPIEKTWLHSGMEAARARSKELEVCIPEIGIVGLYSMNASALKIKCHF